MYIDLLTIWSYARLDVESLHTPASLAAASKRDNQDPDPARTEQLEYASREGQAKKSGRDLEWLKEDERGEIGGQKFVLQLGSNKHGNTTRRQDPRRSSLLLTAFTTSLARKGMSCVRLTNLTLVKRTGN